MKRLITLLACIALLPCLCPRASAQAGTAIAVNPSGVFSYLNVNLAGSLLTAGLATVNTTAQSGVAVALNPSGSLTYLNVDANGGLMISGITNTASGQLILGTPGYTDASGYFLGQITVTGATQGNTYAQFSIQGLNAGTQASTDFVATADNGGATTHFVDIGINSSGNNSGTYPTGANVAYVETSASADPLYVGTGGSAALHLFANNIDYFDISAAGVISEPGSVTGASATYASFIPVFVETHGLTIFTTGASENLGTITIPAGITRYYIPAAGAIQCYAETAAGTLAAGTIQLRTATSGGGSQMGSTITPPASSGAMTTTAGVNTTAWTATTVYLYQTGNSANAGTVSVGLWIVPL